MLDVRSPGCQSRSPTKSKPEPVNRLRCSPMVNSRIRRMISSSISVSSDRLTNGSTPVSLVRIVRRSTFYVRRSWNRHPLDDVGDHAVGGQAVAGGVWAVPEAAAEDIDGEILDVFGIDLGPLADQQRPDFGQASPADDRTRRGAEIDAVLDQLR